MAYQGKREQPQDFKKNTGDNKKIAAAKEEDRCQKLLGSLQAAVAEGTMTELEANKTFAAAKCGGH